MNYALKQFLPLNSFNHLHDYLSAKGVKNLDAFLNPRIEYTYSPRLLNNIDTTIELIWEHLMKDSEIAFVVDCDTDGICSSAILWLYLKQHFPDANFSFLTHQGKQHGLEDMVEIIEQSNFKLIICPDSASGNINEVCHLNEMGIDVAIIDHHEIFPHVESPFIVNNQYSENYPNKSLCGAGMVYKVCQRIDELCDTAYADDYLDLVALANIADVMDQREPETRYLIIKGLSNIQNKGFKTLIESQEYSLKDTVHLTPMKIAFYIAPLINALIRVGTQEEKETLFYCFIAPDMPIQSTKRGAKEGDIELAAEQAARVAKNARARQNKNKDKAIETIDFIIQKNGLLDNKILVVEVPPKDFQPALSGLIAAHFVNKYNRPCAIVKLNDDGYLRGSMRGNDNFKQVPNFKELLENSGQIEYCAGR